MEIAIMAGLPAEGNMQIETGHHFFSTIRKVVPFPISELFTKICPSWYSSMIRLLRDKPNPNRGSWS